MADVGRPTVMTPEVLAKLEEVFALGGSDEEACFYADISTSSLYKYQQEYPDFTERKERLKETPVLKARRTVINSLDKPEHAFKFLERKKRKEFAPPAQSIEHSGEVMAKIIAIDE